MGQRELTEYDLDSLYDVHLTERELLERFNEMLDECFPRFELGTLSYSASDAYESVDPIAYRQEFLNWLDAELSEGNIFEFNGEYYSDDPDNFLK